MWLCASVEERDGGRVCEIEGGENKMVLEGWGGWGGEEGGGGVLTHTASIHLSSMRSSYQTLLFLPPDAATKTQKTINEAVTHIKTHRRQNTWVDFRYSDERISLFCSKRWNFKGKKQTLMSSRRPSFTQIQACAEFRFFPLLKLFSLIMSTQVQTVWQVK